MPREQVWTTTQPVPDQTDGNGSELTFMLEMDFFMA